MSVKKAVMISCFNYYDNRLQFFERYLKQCHYDVTYITSNFDHIAKGPLIIERSGTIQTHTMPYVKNLSAKRMLAHYMWARNTFRQVEMIKPGMLIVMLPPNSMAWRASKYRRRSNCRLIFDIYDLWPESYPLPHISIVKLPFYFWKRMRDKYLGHADFVTTECGMYRDILSAPLKGVPTEILYPTLQDVPVTRKIIWEDNTVHLAYLGSINNIIDVSLIGRLIAEVQRYKEVRLHLIGVGESKAALMSAVSGTGAIVMDYGPVYDPQKKQDILDRCRFGLNIMRDVVCIALTMKSVDYMQAGLPLLSNIPADTQRMIDEFGIGLHIGGGDLRSIAQIIADTTESEHNDQSGRAMFVFNKLFSERATEEKAANILRVVLKNTVER